MKTLTRIQFISNISAMISTIERTGETLIITDHNGRPVLKLQPYRPEELDAFERLRGSIVQYIDLMSSVAEEDWSDYGH